MVSCEIADTGKYDRIIPFRWWHKEPPIKSIETLAQWRFNHTDCIAHIEDESIADMFEWDETVASDESARMIGIIGATRKEEVQLEGLPELYWQYKKLFEDEKAEMLAPRRTFDHATDLKEGATLPWGPIYPRSSYQL